MIFKAEIWGGKKKNDLEAAMRSKENTYLTSCLVWEEKKKSHPWEGQRGYTGPQGKIRLLVEQEEGCC